MAEPLSLACFPRAAGNRLVSAVRRIKGFVETSADFAVTLLRPCHSRDLRSAFRQYYVSRALFAKFAPPPIRLIRAV
jgi:hypothetical protein